MDEKNIIASGASLPRHGEDGRSNNASSPMSQTPTSASARERHPSPPRDSTPDVFERISVSLQAAEDSDSSCIAADDSEGPHDK
eukprot:scaffold68165_cov16-Prasinocladus_malaysianus.AAC.1